MEPFYILGLKNDHHFTQTGSGQTYENVEKIEILFCFCVGNQQPKETAAAEYLGKETRLWRSHFIQKRLFYQDRLGTNIGKAIILPRQARDTHRKSTQNKRLVFLQGGGRRAGLGLSISNGRARCHGQVRSCNARPITITQARVVIWSDHLE